jgi:hypothetical protein
VGGITHTTNNAELFDPATHTWTFVGTNGPHFGHTLTTLADGRALMVYGSSAKIFNPTNYTWTEASGPTFYRHGHLTVLLHDGRVLCMGGAEFPNSLRCEIYNPAIDQWTNASNLKSPDRLAALLLPSGKVLMLGYRDVQIYDANTDTWSLRTPLPEQPSGTAAALLANGLVLVTTQLGSFSSPSYLYDPVRDEWMQTSAPSQVRYARPLRLPDGKVLFAGHEDATAEVYDPLSRTWSFVGSMSTNRHAYQAVLLQDGRALIIGGAWRASEALSGVEFYSSSNLTFTPLRLNAPMCTNGTLTVTFTNIPNVAFGVTASTNVANDEWFGINAVTQSSPGHYHFTDATTNGPRRFYRISTP